MCLDKCFPNPTDRSSRALTRPRKSSQARILSSRGLAGSSEFPPTPSILSCDQISCYDYGLFRKLEMTLLGTRACHRIDHAFCRLGDVDVAAHRKHQHRYRALYSRNWRSTDVHWTVPRTLMDKRVICAHINPICRVVVPMLKQLSACDHAVQCCRVFGLIVSRQQT